MEAKSATEQLAAFDRFCGSCEILPLTDEVIKRAAKIYAKLRTTGQTIGDADILIAATAIEHGLTLATNNEAHFARIDSLSIDNWAKG